MRTAGMVFSMVNPDQHDRILTDPAYRLQRLTEIDNKAQIYQHALQ
jgi:D-lyxose ketol-isomerase